MRVVCIDDKNMWWSFPGEPNAKPVKGEIYTVTGICHKEYYIIKELAPDECYLMDIFRPVDDTYGPAICQTIEEKIEYEKVT